MTHITEYDFEEEEAEEVLHTLMKTGWPKPLHRWRLVYEVYNQSIEELYFWAIDELKEEEGFPEFDKITDLFAASEQSAFFGVSQQRLGLQQDKVSQFLATIGKMVKELFQLVREIRILDERLEFYIKSNQGDEAAEITLKGYWIDLVEGGAKNPASVYGMSRELGFTTLPDLFFAAPPIASANVDRYVASLEFNRKLKEVLSRKLKTFLVWKENTYKEMKSRRIFTIKYLRQHYDIIRMYMNWVKPYLRNIRRLHMDQKKMDTAHLINAFEGSMIEIEVLAKRPIAGGKYYAIVSLHFDYRSRPEMKYQQEGYQRGPIHTGRTTLTCRAYTWTPEQIEKYKKFREKEDFDLLATIDASVEAAYTSLGDELERYLAEAGEYMGPGGKKAEEKPKMPSVFDPLFSVVKGVGELAGAFGGGSKQKKPGRKEAFELEDARKEAEEFAYKHMYGFIKRYKAAHGWVY